MKSVSGKNWEEIKLDKRLIDKVKIDENFDTIQAKLVVSRHFSKTEIFSIKYQTDVENPFFKNKDFLSACSLLKKHINRKSKIFVIGDYDVDGCVSTSLIVSFLKKKNINVNYYIPDRILDGYGANINLIKKLIFNDKPDLIIFLDCGSSSYDVTKYIKSLKIYSLIIDHHNSQKPYPLSEVFINPKKNSNYKNYDYLCTAFLTYLFLDLYIKLNHIKISIKEHQIYVLLATVADVMPIRNINRILAINVLKNFNLNNNFVLSNLFKILKIKKKIELDDLGFIIAPILNSAGRLDNANQIVELLVTSSKHRIVKILEKIFHLNSKRKIIEKKCLDNLNFNNISKQEGVIFIYEPNISEGIIGIIAAKIKEYFNKPCIMLTNSGKIIKGSARSTSKFNIGEYINKALDMNILLSGGGHNLAAGVSLLKGNLNIFKDYIDKSYKKKNFDSVNNFVSKISLSSINKNFLNNINYLGPFGNKNANPVFLIQNVKIIKPNLLKNRFFSCFVKSSNKLIKAISFSHSNTKVSYEILNSKNDVDLLVKIKENKWNNKSTIELEIVDIIKPANNT